MTKSKAKKEIDVDSLSLEEATEIGTELGKKLGALGDATSEKANKITEAYGIKTRVLIQLIDAKTGEPLT
jgi:hypothetical protein